MSDVALNQDFSSIDREKERVAQLERNDARREPSSQPTQKCGGDPALFNCSSRWMTYELLSRERSTSCSSSNFAIRQVQSTVTEDKAKLFGGLDGVDMEELERALTIVKKREHMKNPDDFDFSKN